MFQFLAHLGFDFFSGESSDCYGRVIGIQVDTAIIKVIRHVIDEHDEQQGPKNGPLWHAVFHHRPTRSLAIYLCRLASTREI